MRQIFSNGFHRVNQFNSRINSNTHVFIQMRTLAMINFAQELNLLTKQGVQKATIKELEKIHDKKELQDLSFAELLDRTTQSLEQNHRFDEAEPLIKRALTIYEGVNGPNHPTVAACLNTLARLYSDEGKFDEAESLLKRSLSINENHFGKTDHSEIANSLESLGVFYLSQERYAECGVLFQRALRMQENLFGLHHPNVAETLILVAELFKRQKEAGSIIEQTLKRSLFILDKSNDVNHDTLFRCLKALVSLYFDQERYSNAEPFLKRMIEIEEIHNKDDDYGIAELYNELGSVLSNQGKLDEAVAAFKKTLEIYEKVSHNYEIGKCLINLGNVLRDQKIFDEAESCYLKALQALTDELGPNHLDVALALKCLAELKLDQKQLPEAESYVQRALHIVETSFGKSHIYTASCLIVLASINYSQKKINEAELVYERIISIYTKELGSTHASLAPCLQSLGTIYHEQKRLQEAEKTLTKSLEIFQTSVGPDHPYVACCLDSLGLVYKDMGRTSAYESLLRQANEIMSSYEKK